MSERTQRISDGTISLLGKRFEIPASYRALYRLTVRYAEWDLRHVSLVDPRTDATLSPLYPLDRARNAEGLQEIGPATAHPAPDKTSVPPLLQKIMADYAATGLPPAFIADPKILCNRRFCRHNQPIRRKSNWPKYQALYGLKWNPFTQDIPPEAILKTPRFNQFCRVSSSPSKAASPLSPGRAALANRLIYAPSATTSPKFQKLPWAASSGPKVASGIFTGKWAPSLASSPGEQPLGRLQWLTREVAPPYRLHFASPRTPHR